MLLLISPVVLWISGPSKLLRIVLGIVLSDLLVDLSHRGEYEHRCRLLEPMQGIVKKNKGLSMLGYQRSRMFYLLSHCLANLYVIGLEFGRLWGHIVVRKDPFRGFCHRFDWHCGRLEKAPHNFRKREGWKFGIFLGILLYEVPVVMPYPFRHACDANIEVVSNTVASSVMTILDVIMTTIARN